MNEFFHTNSNLLTIIYVQCFTFQMKSIFFLLEIRDCRMYYIDCTKCFIRWGDRTLGWCSCHTAHCTVTLCLLCTVWKLRKFTATIFSQKFRESNFLQKNFTLNWFDEKKLYGREFLVFPHCVVEITFLTENSWK